MVDCRLRPDFYAALVEGASELTCAFDPCGDIVFASSASLRVLGWTPDQLVGRNIGELVHPEDLERAWIGVAESSELGVPDGTSSFRVMGADGSYADLDMSIGDVDLGGSARLISVSCRPGDFQHSIDELMRHLLDGATPAADQFLPVLESIAWKANGSNVAIAWHDEWSGHEAVSTGLPAMLTGAEADPGEPWARARATGREVVEAWPVPLDPARAAAATDLGLGSLWIVPVPDPGSDVPALITVWNKPERPVRGHGYGMSVATRLTDLILHWRYQVGRLEDAAYRDPLTGLGNRHVFFDALDRERPSGALLFCDLDRFKPVNDRYGHAAGDDVLRHVATRLRSCVRAEDLLARIGGDEFVVLCRSATVAQASELAERITAAFEEPFVVAGTKVDIGISIGIAHANDGLTEETLDAADRDLYEQKARRTA